jgi:hypothetical protein
MRLLLAAFAVFATVFAPVAAQDLCPANLPTERRLLFCRARADT